MSSEQKISAKPKVYQLTDFWVPRILVVELALVWILAGFFHHTYFLSELIQALLAPLIMPAFAFTSMRYLFPGILRNQSFNDAGRKFVIGFMWFGGIFMHVLILMMIPDFVNESVNLITAILISMIGFSFSLGISLGSESFFESLSQDQSEIENEN